MKKISIISGIFLGGVIVGAILMNLLHMYARPTYRNMIRTEIKTDQEFLAGRATREGNNLEAVMHRWFVLELDSNNKFHMKRNKDMDSSFLFPFYMAPLRMMEDSNRKTTETGWYIVEGIDHGNLAVALEAVGDNSEATRQWDQAQNLLRKKSTEDTRKVILDLLALEKTDLHLKAEEKILGDNKEAQQKHPAESQ